jgi:hypothetical protein
MREPPTRPKAEYPARTHTGAGGSGWHRTTSPFIPTEVCPTMDAAYEKKRGVA